MRLYPQLLGPRFQTLARDVALVLALVVFGLIGLRVHDAVDRLAVLGEGVHEAGSSIQGGFDAAADAADKAPVIGGPVADALRDAGEGSGGQVADLGTRGEENVHKLANVLGLLVFGLPAAVLLIWYLPDRAAQIRRLTDAARVIGEHESVERRRLVAMRAAFSLPYGVLLRHTRDPLGDLAAERYDALVAAALEAEGLRPRPTS
jgi:hypothetical protein